MGLTVSHPDDWMRWGVCNILQSGAGTESGSQRPIYKIVHGYRGEGPTSIGQVGGRFSGHLLRNSLLFLVFCDIWTFSWLDRAHPHCGRQSAEPIGLSVDLIFEHPHRSIYSNAGLISRHQGSVVPVYKTVNEKIPENKPCLQRPIKISMTVEFGLLPL